LDGTHIKVTGIWCYLYGAVDYWGNSSDFVLRKRGRPTAKRNDLQSLFFSRDFFTCPVLLSK
jgi:hypothetical protein